jgi:hypothetical protein
MPKPEPKEDAALAPAAVVHAMVQVTQRLQALERDLKLLRGKIDQGDAPKSMQYGVLSAQLMAAELQLRIVQLQIVLADEMEE